MTQTTKKRNYFLVLMLAIFFAASACVFALIGANTVVRAEEPSDAETIVKPTTLEELRAADPAKLAKLESFDERDYDLVPLKDRNQVGTNLCWAFATTAAVEINILRNGLDPTLTNETIDFSEKYLGWSRVNRDGSVDPLGNTDGFTYSGSGDSWSQIGSPADAAQIMLQWVAPVNQTVPTLTDINSDENARIKSRSDVAFYAEEAIFLDVTDRNAIKEAIIKYGAVTSSFKFAHSSYRNAKYYSGKNVSDPATHACVIIGWDDTIDKNLFQGGTKPSENGAWILRESYEESSHGGDGCFYLSYNTDFPQNTVIAYNMARTTDYDNNYYYDGNIKSTLSIKSSGTTSAAAVFKSKSNLESKKVELLKAVNIGVDTVTGSKTLKVDIYTGVAAASDPQSASNNPTSGTLRVTKEVTINSNGGHLVTLDEPIELREGEYFSVVASVTSCGIMSCSVNGMNADNTRTYFYDNVKKVWKNMLDYDITGVARIKAFTVEEVDERTDLYKCSVSIENNEFSYTGSAIAPAVTITNGNVTLTSDDYTVTYEDNIYVGQATATVTGKGNYKGTVRLTFNIVRANRIITVIIEDRTFGESYNEPIVSGEGIDEGDVGFMYSDAIDGDYSTNVPTAVGTYYVIAIIRESANYLMATSEPVQFKILASGQQDDDGNSGDNGDNNDQEPEPGKDDFTPPQGMCATFTFGGGSGLGMGVGVAAFALILALSLALVFRKRATNKK